MTNNTSNRKVFGIGMFRTGTTTLGTCLGKLGFRHQGYWYVTDYSTDELSDRLADAWPTILERAGHYDSFEDAPWLFLYRELDTAFPGSRFILTRRSNSEKLAESERRWHIINGATEDSMPSSEFFIGRYESHNAAVREYFADRPDDLLEICWEEGDGWEKLCEFLGVDVPRDRSGNILPVPRVNASHPWRRWIMSGKRMLKKIMLKKS